MTLDSDSSHKPDIVHDLEVLPLPFEDNSFDEIHAYEILEHTGQQGDYRFFFAQWTEFHRILRPDGYVLGTCPSHRSLWAWGDPGHKRVLTTGSFVFLSQRQYRDQVGRTAMSDFRSIYKVDFEILHCVDDDETLEFVLKAKK